LHNFHVSADEDWVKFYAPTGYVFAIDATQLGTNSNLVLELYYEQPDGVLTYSITNTPPKPKAFYRARLIP
jgi:hypothetical protein